MFGDYNRPLVQFNWNGTPMKPMPREYPMQQGEINFSSYMLGQMAQITIGDMPCGQLTLPVGFLGGTIYYDGHERYVPMGDMFVRNNKKYFNNVFFPEIISNSFLIETEKYLNLMNGSSGANTAPLISVEQPPIGTFALVAYKDAANLPSELEVNINTYDSTAYEWSSGNVINFNFNNSDDDLHFCLVRCTGSGLSNSDTTGMLWEEVDAQNGVYVYPVCLDGEDLTNTNDDIDEDNISLPDPDTIAEDFLLLVKYHATQVSSLYQSTNQNDIAIEFYYKGVRAVQENGYTEEVSVWIPISAGGTDGVYVYPVCLNDDNLDSYPDGDGFSINRYEIELPDASLIKENLLLVVAYRDMERSYPYKPTGSSSYQWTDIRTTIPRSIRTFLYYKGEERDAEVTPPTNKPTWLPVPDGDSDDPLKIYGHSNAYLSYDEIVDYMEEEEISGLLQSFSGKAGLCQCLGENDYTSYYEFDFINHSSDPEYPVDFDKTYNFRIDIAHYLTSGQVADLSDPNESINTVLLAIEIKINGERQIGLFPVFNGYDDVNEELIPIKTLKPGIYDFEFTYGHFYLIGEHHEDLIWNDWEGTTPTIDPIVVPPNQ